MNPAESAYPWSHYPFEVRTVDEGKIVVSQRSPGDADSSRIVVPAAFLSPFIDVLETMAHAFELGDLEMPREFPELHLEVFPLPDGRLLLEQIDPNNGEPAAIVIAASQVGGLIQSIREGSGEHFGLMVAPVGGREVIRIIQDDGDESESVLLGRTQVHDLLELLCEVAGIEKPGEEGWKSSPPLE